MGTNPLSETEREAVAARWRALNDQITACRLCPRLVSWREEVARVRKRAFRDWDYWGKPVPGFGDRHARLLVIGLAPGAHGSNRTGRMFTGDASGEFLYSALHRAGLANQPTANSRDDGLQLKDVFITAICRCAPPANRPSPQEIHNCQPYLEQEMTLLAGYQGIVALGSLAFQQVLTIFNRNGRSNNGYNFQHNALYHLGDGMPWLLASYHPSRQNTQTGRLTPAMFYAVWQRAVGLLVDGSG